MRTFKLVLKSYNSLSLQVDYAWVYYIYQMIRSTESEYFENVYYEKKFYLITVDINCFSIAHST